MRVKTKCAKKGTKSTVADRACALSKTKTVATKPETPVPLKREKTQRVTFAIRADPGSTVFLAGSFNSWDPTAKRMTDKNGEGLFTVVIPLTPGEYQYKFVINGTWCADPECADWVQNEHGTLNSIKRVEA